MKNLAIDLGGTNIRIARVENGHVVAHSAVPCLSTSSKEEVLSQIFGLIDSVIEPGVGKIGVGVPSVVDNRAGIVYNVQNIPSWDEVHLKEIIEDRYGVNTVVDNDVNCFVLGEKYFGVGRPYQDLVGITLGTGVGAGIMIREELYRGSNTGAGEIGCLPYLDSDYEHYCSSLFLKKSDMTGKELADKAVAGDKKALDLWRLFGFHLGKLLQVVLYTYDPQIIIIGGGISSSASYFSESMMESLRKGFPYPHEVDSVKICFSTLQNCNLLGASRL